MQNYNVCRNSDIGITDKTLSYIYIRGKIKFVRDNCVQSIKKVSFF